MTYNYIEDFEGVTDLLELGGTASMSFTAFNGMRIKPSDNGETIFYQYAGSKGPEKIEEAEIVYFGPEEEVLDILNITEEEFEDEYQTAPGFSIGDQIYLIEEFVRDDY